MEVIEEPGEELDALSLFPRHIMLLTTPTPTTTTPTTSSSSVPDGGY
jgi:hypothetical protein